MDTFDKTVSYLLVEASKWVLPPSLGQTNFQHRSFLPLGWASRRDHVRVTKLSSIPCSSLRSKIKHLKKCRSRPFITRPGTLAAVQQLRRVLSEPMSRTGMCFFFYAEYQKLFVRNCYYGNLGIIRNHSSWLLLISVSPFKVTFLHPRENCVRLLSSTVDYTMVRCAFISCFAKHCAHIWPQSGSQWQSPWRSK